MASVRTIQVTLWTVQQSTPEGGNLLHINAIDRQADPAVHHPVSIVRLRQDRPCALSKES